MLFNRWAVFLGLLIYERVVEITDMTLMLFMTLMLSLDHDVYVFNRCPHKLHISFDGIRTGINISVESVQIVNI